jgi:hypothetical protein
LENESRNEILILQPHLINNLKDKLEEVVVQKRDYLTPGTPRLKIVCPEDNSELIDDETQKRYHYGVGMLLYLTKYLQPDLCNVVRELSKCMDGATMGTYLEMLRVLEISLMFNQYLVYMFRVYPIGILRIQECVCHQLMSQH